jgi:hypothetical protein
MPLKPAVEFAWERQGISKSYFYRQSYFMCVFIHSPIQKALFGTVNLIKEQKNQNIFWRVNDSVKCLGSRLVSGNSVRFSDQLSWRWRQKMA